MIKEITSLQNELIKNVAELKQKKYRNLTHSFFLEGKRAVAEVLAAKDWPVEAVFCTKEQVAWVNAHAYQGELYVVPEKIMAKLCDTQTPQGVGAVVSLKAQGFLADFTYQEGLVLVLDGVKDPGNIGTIIRTADAAGAQAVVLLNETGDLFNPKVMRSTMGSIFHLPVFADVSTEEFFSWCEQEKVPLWATSLEGAEDIFTAKWPKRVALVLGSEAEGVSPQMLAAAQKHVFIPMSGRAESLNVAVAAGICLFAHPRS